MASRDEACLRVAYRILRPACSRCRKYQAVARGVRLSPRSADALARLEGPVSHGEDWEEAFRLVARLSDHFEDSNIAAVLLGKARDELPGQPARSARWAELAAMVASLGATLSHRQHLACAIAYQGNAIRVLGREIGDAEPWFTCARLLLRRFGSTLEASADIDQLTASWLVSQRRFDESRYLLFRASSIFLGLSDNVMMARTFLTLALTYSLEGNPHKALELAQISYLRSSRAGDTALRFIGLLHLTSYAENSGAIWLARRSLDLATSIPDRPHSKATELSLRGLSLLLDAHDGLPEALDLLWDLYENHFAGAPPHRSLAVLLDIARVTPNRDDLLARLASAVSAIHSRVPPHHVHVRKAVNSLQNDISARAVTPVLALRYSAYFLLANRDPRYIWVR